MISTGRRIFRYSLFLILSSTPAFADQPRQLIDQGNKCFEAGRYAEALEAYDQIGNKPAAAIAAELLHDRAAAHFKLGQTDDARELWVRAAGLKDEPFEAAARYNLGNCDYADALKALKAQDANAALELLGRALQQYRDALRLDPARLDARANFELAAQLKKQIEEQAQQQPQSQPSPGQKENNEQREQQGQSSSQPSTQPSQSEQRDQSKQGKDQEQEQQPSQQQPTTQPETQPAPKPQPASQPQTMEGEEEQEEPQPMVPIEMTREEAERLLQMIRDAERQRRAILRAREAAGQKPVDKDW
jgi:Ca-activated chloride channel family protein